MINHFSRIALPCLALALAACGGKKPAEDAATTPPPEADAEKPSTADAAATPTPNAATSGTLKFVSSLPRTGSANAQTTTIVNGIKMAVDEVGAKVGDFSIVYEDWDDASAKKGDWDPEVEAGNADKAVGDPDVVAYIGTYNSGAAMISMPVLNKANLLMVSPANTYPALTKPGTGEAHEPDAYRPSGKVNYFRVVPADDMQGAVGARWAQKLGAKSVYTLHDNGLYGKGVASVFQQTAEDIGLRVLAFEAVDPKAQEYKSLMTKVKEANPDFVYYGGTTQTNAGQLVKDFVAVGATGKIMVPDGCYEKAFIQAAGADNANERVYVTFGGVPPEKLTGKGADFVKAYREKFGSEPEAYAVYGYVATQVALEAIKAAGKKDRAAITAAAANVKFEDSALGAFSFTEHGDTTMAVMSGNIVRNGEFEFVSLLGNE